MKFNKNLLVISLIFLFLISLTAVSAAETNQTSYSEDTIISSSESSPIWGGGEFQMF